MRDKYDIVIFDGVYPPSEDTYLLLDAIDIISDDMVLDVGCGVGLASMAVSAISKRVVSLDISLDAVKNTNENMKRNFIGKNVSIVQSDLLSSISEKAKFSLILFNPPYLPEEENHTEMDYALVGGTQGIELTQRFIIEASQHLTENGRVYVVVSTLADVEAILATLRENLFDVILEKEETLFFEKIQVLKGVWRGHKETVL